MNLSEERAKKTIEILYSNPKNWRRKEFRDAYFVLTGQKQVMSEEIAREIIKAWVDDDKRKERVEYVSALLLITGKWILPTAVTSSGMSSQIKARYSSGDLRVCFSPLAYRK
ncbi:hypothetical protein M2G69_21655 [Vibrio vulnificus]|nr:hypothetical protein [Vibrio vulnificus]